jgi:nucleotide-binding universal stress UspA family protein
MSIKTITAFLDESETSWARLEAACALAQARNAHLVAVACMRQIDVGVYAMPGAEMALDLASIDQSRDRARAMAREAAERIERFGLTPDTRWASSIAAGLEETAARAARHSDLAVLSPVGGEGPAAEVADAVLEGVLFSSGRPALVVPHDWKGARIGSKIMIAWDGSRVASRALHDALPFIEKAGAATIAIVDPEPGIGGVGEEPGADIAAVIARHGVKVEVESLASAGASTAERLMTTASDMSADLMVMGGYGHSRWREAIFSGVSREVLEAPSVPVLISH